MIPGITDRTRFPRLAKIRLGEKRVGKSGNEYPAKLPHFNLVDAPAVAKIFGDKPVMLAPLLLPGNPVHTANGWDFSSYWRTSRSAYGKSSGLFCRCDDGVTALRVNMGTVKDGPNAGKVADAQGAAFIQQQGLDVAVGEMFQMPCPAEECPYWEAKRCKNLASFDFMLPAVPGFGTWCIQTSSFHSIRNVESMLQTLAAATGGIVAGIPLGLKLVPQQAHVEGKAVEIYVLEMVCPHNLQQLAGLRRRAIASGGAVVAGLIEGPEPPPDDLFSFGGAALDAELAGRPAPEKTELRAAPQGGKLDELTREMAPEPAPQQALIPTEPGGMEDLLTPAEREKQQVAEHAHLTPGGKRKAAPAAKPNPQAPNGGLPMDF